MSSGTKEIGLTPSALSLRVRLLTAVMATSTVIGLNMLLAC